MTLSFMVPLKAFFFLVPFFIRLSCIEQQILAISPLLQEAIEVALSQARALRIGEGRAGLRGMAENGQFARYNGLDPTFAHGEGEVDVHEGGKAVTLVKESGRLEEAAPEGHTGT